MKHVNRCLGLISVLRWYVIRAAYQGSKARRLETMKTPYVDAIETIIFAKMG